MVDIQPVAAEIRRGKKEEDSIDITGQKYNGPLLHRAAITKFAIFAGTCGGGIAA